MKNFDLKMQAEQFGTLILPLGTIVRLDPVSYSGDKDRLDMTAKIIGIEMREIPNNHFAAIKLECTHEDVYVVLYSDGVKCVLWPEEILEVIK